MSDILAKMQAAHDERAKMTAVEVPEYGITLYFPPLTLADRSYIRKIAGSEDDVELMICTMIRMAHDEEGNRVFKDDGPSRKTLHEMQVSTMQWIMERADPGPAEAEPAKND